MGYDKAFLEINGKTFLQNAIDILTPVCKDRVKVVLNQKQADFIEKLPEGLPYIFDIYEDRGPLGGIHAALKDCDSVYAVILPVDLPFLTVDFVSQITETALDSKADVVLPKHPNGKTEQLCTVYETKAALPIIENLFRDESTSISVLQFIGKLKNKKYLELESEDKNFANINKPEHYRKLNQ